MTNLKYTAYLTSRISSTYARIGNISAKLIVY